MMTDEIEENAIGYRRGEWWGGGGGGAGGKREWQREYGHAEVGKRGCGEDGLAGRGTGEATAGRRSKHIKKVSKEHDILQHSMRTKSHFQATGRACTREGEVWCA